MAINPLRWLRSDSQDYVVTIKMYFRRKTISFVQSNVYKLSGL
jgi:hypothetical protein